MAKKTVSDTLQETLAQVVREAIGNIGGEEPQKAKKGVLGGGKGLFAGAGLAAAAPLLKKAVDALRDGSLDEMIADLKRSPRPRATTPARPRRKAPTSAAATTSARATTSASRPAARRRPARAGGCRSSRPST